MPRRSDKALKESVVETRNEESEPVSLGARRRTKGRHLGRRTPFWRRREESLGSRTRGCNRLTRRSTSSLPGALDHT